MKIPNRKIPNRKFSVRKTIAAAVTSTALVAAGLAGAGEAAAAPTGDALIAQQALEGIEPSPQDAADVIGGIEAANALLERLGITPFTPTIGACTDFSFPLALGGAVPGPYTPGIGDLTLDVPFVGEIDANAVRSGQIMYGFLPVGTFNDSGNKSGMQIAWINIDTFEGGLSEPMDGLAETVLNASAERAGLDPDSALLAPLRAALSVLPSNGARGGLVETGGGTVLSAIYGTVQKEDATCYFFPSLGIAVAGGSDAGDSDSEG